MSGKSSFVRRSLSEIEQSVAKGEDRTRSEAPEAESLGAAFWKSARVVERVPKAAVSLRLDQDVLDWFKAQGQGHLTRMNAVLRSYVDAQGAAPRRARAGKR
jgi:uncharacterized protein (DUF4415 family)